MKINKTRSISSILLIGVLLIFSGCLKNEDPLYAGFISSDARLKGSWRLVKFDGRYDQEHDGIKYGEYYNYDRSLSSTFTLSIDMTYNYYYVNNFKLFLHFDGSQEATLDVNGYVNDLPCKWNWLNDKQAIDIEYLDFINGICTEYVIEELSQESMILQGKVSEKLYDEDGDEYDVDIRLDYTFEKMD